MDAYFDSAIIVKLYVQEATRSEEWGKSHNRGRAGS
jgi:hypothetical protein